jgi:aryl-alcohol dehydrogenase-like predicted oxidoreductase
LLITPVGYGTWAIGGFGWGEQDDKRSIAAIDEKSPAPAMAQLS